jgi:hypothetical protein
LVGIKDPEKKKEALATAAARVETPEFFTRKRHRVKIRNLRIIPFLILRT